MSSEMDVMEYYYEGGYLSADEPHCMPEKHFVVEDLLDFSNDVEEEEEAVDVAGAGGINSSSVSSSSSVTADNNSCSNSFSSTENQLSRDLGLPDTSISGDLCDPYQDLAELEWLSNFVEESFSNEDLEKLHLISGLKGSSAAEAGRVSQPSPPMFLQEAPVPGKARSKRSRVTPCSWSSSRLLSLSPTPLSPAASESELFIPVSPPCSLTAAKKAAKKEASEGPRAPAPSDGRRCLHCATDKTPQWRTGPMGPKTLCNACGVRYKSGRLVPEYRPAASPTFSLSKHSNSHRKVLELRRHKEMQQHESHFMPRSRGVYDSPANAGDDFLIHHFIGPDFRQLI